MKKFFFLMFAVLAISSTMGQVSGTFSIPGDYATIRAAIDAINAQGVAGSGAVFNVQAGHTEASPDSLVLYASGRETGYIVFQKTGIGNNPVVARLGSGVHTTTTIGGRGDAVIAIEASDYVKFSGIDVADTSQGIEYGYYLRKSGPTDACKNIIIENCSIDLTKGNSPYVVGIYVSNNDAYSPLNSNAGVFLTSISGRHENITIRGNTIQDVVAGVFLRGFAHTSDPYDFYDQNVVVGESGAGNIIRNFGGGTASAAYGVYGMYNQNLTIGYNIIHNTGGGGVDATSSIYGVYLVSSLNAASVMINNNSITLGQGSTSAASCIYISHKCSELTISGNTFSYGTFASTSSSYLIYCSNATPFINVFGNQNSSAISKTGATGSFYGYYNLGSPVGGLERVFQNTFSNISLTGSAGFYGIYSGTSATHSKEIFNNIMNNVTAGSGISYGIYSTYGTSSSIYANQLNLLSGAGVLYGILAGNTSSNLQNIYGNEVHGLSSNGSASAVYGIATASADTTHIYANKVYDIQTNSSGGSVYGLNCASGNYIFFSNNYISELKGTVVNAANNIIGINIAGGTNAGAFYNTIYLNASSSGELFGSSGIYASSTVNLDLRNNIIVNKSNRSGSLGYTVAFRRGGAITGLNYASSSNTNNYFASSSSPAFNYIFYDGTTTGKDSTMEAFQTRVSPRDGGSFTEDPPFINVVSAPYNLHLQPVQTKCESGGLPVSMPLSLTTDYDGDARYPNPGYPNNPLHPAVAPDVGADEFAGQSNFTCQTPNPGNTLTTLNQICYGKTVTLSLENPISGTGVTYQWQSSVDSVVFSDISGANGSSYTLIPNAPLWFRCHVVCQSGPTEGYSTPLRITFAYDITSTAGASRCGAGTLTLQATANGGTIKWYDTPSGGTLMGSGITFTTPVISQTTDFYVVTENIGLLETVGKITPVSTTNTSLSNYGMVFNVIQEKTLQSVDVFPATTAGQMNIALYQNSVLLQGPVNFSFPAGNGSVPFTATLNFTIPAGTGYRLLITSMSGGNLVRESTGSSYPYTSPSISITSGATSLTGTSTSAYYWFYNWKVQSKCTSPAYPVTATIGESPELTITGDQNICNDVVQKLQVTSPSSFFDVFLWSPLDHLFTDLACTIPYNGVSSALSVYFKTSDPGVHTITCSANNFTTQCSNVAEAEITVLPSGQIITANPGQLCISGSSSFSVSPGTGYGSATFQWQESTDNLNYTDIPGATNLNYSTPNIGITTYYKLITRNGSGQICLESQITLNVDNPIVISSVPGFRCGTGTVELAASATQGVLHWYDNPNGGIPLGTGSPFTTPVINTSKTYYVGALMPGTILEPAGRSKPTGTTGGTLSNYGLVFSADQYISLKSVDVYPSSTAGTLSVALYNSSSTLLAGPTYFSFPAGTGATPYTLDLNYSIPAGTGYRLLITGMAGGNLIRETTGITYPIHSDSLISITSGATSLTGTSSSAYYWFYNWNVMFGCASPLIPVLATVNVAPVLQLSDSATVCNNEASLISVISNPAEYDTYTWTPVDDLYLDAAGTIPYTAGANSASVYLKSVVGGEHSVYCHAYRELLGCVNDDTAHVFVIPTSPEIVSTPEAICISDNATLSLEPSVGYGEASFQWSVSTDGITYSEIPGATNITYTTGVVDTITYYKLVVKNGLGVFCTDAFFSLSVVNPHITNTFPGTRCGQGTVDLSATASPGAAIKWYSADQGGVLLGSGPDFTTPVIANTTSFWVSAVSDEASGSGSVGAFSKAIGAGALQSLTHYLKFNVVAASMYLEGVYVYPGAAGNVVLHISTSTGTVLYTITHPVTASDVNNKTYIPIGKTISSGIDYRIGWATGGVTMFRNDEGAVYPYTLDGVVSITGNSFNVNYYYYCYDWRVSSSCESAKTEVVATVTIPPAITTAASPDSICVGQNAEISVTSGNQGYAYIWTPGNLEGASHSVNPEESTIYSVTATDTVTGCNTSGSVTVTVLPTPNPVVVTPSAPVIAPGETVSLVATDGIIGLDASFGTGTTNNGTTSYPGVYNNYYGGAKHQMLIRASELTSAGLAPGSPIFSVQFRVNILGSAFPGYLAGYRMDIGHTAATVLTSTSFIGGLTNVVTPDTLFIPATGNYNHVFTNPFIWNGTDNLIIQTSWSNGQTSSSTTRSVQMPYTAAGFVACNYYRANSATAAAVLSAATPSGSSSNRPNMVLGYGRLPNLAWAPIGGLFKDAGATIPYSGENSDTVYAKPDVTTTYEVTASSSLNGCVNSGEVTVSVLIPCPMPESVTVTNITSTSATLGWSEPLSPPGSGYEYEIRTSGNPGDPVGYVTSGSTIAGVTSVLITSLMPNTAYHAFVRSNCGDNVYSSWTTDYPFTTLNIPPLGVTANVTNSTCPEACDGAITTTVTGGVAPYAYLWSNASTSASLTGLCPGMYYVTVTDAASTTATGSWEVGITNPICDNITVTGVVDGTECFNALNTITVAGTPNTFTVTPTGDATFIAGVKILFLPGTTVQLGGYMHGYIAPAGPFCGAAKLTEVTAKTEEVPVVTDRGWFTLFPNPTSGDFTLVRKGEQTTGDIRIEIYGMNGERVLTETMIGAKHEFRFSGMPVGLYFVKVVADGYVETIKLVKTR